MFSLEFTLKWVFYGTFASVIIQTFMSLRDISGPQTVTGKITLTCNYVFLCQCSPWNQGKEGSRKNKLHFALAKKALFYGGLYRRGLFDFSHNARNKILITLHRWEKSQILLQILRISASVKIMWSNCDLATAYTHAYVCMQYRRQLWKCQECSFLLMQMAVFNMFVSIFRYRRFPHSQQPPRGFVWPAVASQEAPHATGDINA